MIKMVVTDLDETLLKTDKTVSQYTIDMIKQVSNQGIKFIFATARGSSASNLISHDLFDGYVLMNGAKAYVENRLVYDKTIPAHIFIPFLQTLSNHGLRVAAEINGIHYANFNVNEKWTYINNFVVTDYRDVAGGADKLYALIESPHQVDLINSIVPRGLYLNVSRDGMAMVMDEKATKINAILRIADEFNISKDEILAFGDDINDKAMLSNCGMSVAMGNALEDIKAITDYICDTNDNDGVAKWLEDHILSRNSNTLSFEQD